MSKSCTHRNNPHNCRSAEQIMVSRQDLVFGNPNLGEPDKAHAIIAPPAWLANNSAPCIKAGHEAQEMVSWSDLMCISHVQWLLYGSGVAKANVSLLDDTRNQLKTLRNPFVIMLWLFCFIHQLHIIAMLLLMSLDGKQMTRVSDVYCCPHVLRAPGYFLKILQAVGTALRASNRGVSIVRGPRPAGAHAHNCKKLELLGSDVEDPDLRRLLEILNDFWCNQWCTHYCECEPQCDFETLLEELTILLSRVLYGRMPSIPTAARWMLVFMTMRRSGLQFAVCGIGRRIVLTAISPAFVRDALAPMSQEDLD